MPIKWSHVLFAAASFLLAAAGVLTVSPEEVRWLLVVAAGLAFVCGVGVRRREGWARELDKNVEDHITVLHDALRGAYNRWRQSADGEVPEHWEDLARLAPWRYSYEEINGGHAAQLLDFAEAVYTPDRTANLKRQSCVPGKLFDEFHDPARRDMAHYLADAGERARRYPIYGWWLRGHLQERRQLVKMVVYLSLPLTFYTNRPYKGNLSDHPIAEAANAISQPEPQT